MLQLHSFEFEEFLGTPKHWKLENTTFREINLIVGRNASGKSRILAILTNLAKLLRGEVRGIFPHASYKICLQSPQETLIYELSTGADLVTRESLWVNAIPLLQRLDTGRGTITSSKLEVEKLLFR